MVKLAEQELVIKLHRAEGPTQGECVGEWMTFNTFEAANRQLLLNSRTAPANGACDKHDFIVQFPDGSSYKGRYDLHRDEQPSLQRHMRNFIQHLLSDRAEDLILNKEALEKQRREGRAILRQLDLKYPNCVVCQRLVELGVDSEKINDYHESKIGMEDFPKEIFEELCNLFEELDSNTHLIRGISH